MSESMTFNLIGNDRLSRSLRQAGDSAGDLQRRLDDAARSGSASLAGLTRDANGRFRDLNGRFVTAGELARRMGDDIDGGSRRGRLSLRSLTSTIRGVASSAKAALPSLGGAGGGLVGSLKGIGVAAGVSALPALGALVPMLTGGAAAAVTAKLAFGGVSDAVKLAGEDQEKYREELAKMGPEQRAFTKAIVATKTEFKGFGKEVQKIVLPSFTRALKQADPAIGIVKDGVRSMSKVFADFGDDFGKLFGSNRFQKALRKNFDLGSGFFRQITEPLDDFTLSLLEFGAASKPTLDAFGKGIGDLLGKGLPGFFKGLQGGIKGSAKMFEGLFGAINKVLPAFGEFAGAVADAAGPAIAQIFESTGDTGAKAFRGLAGAVRFLRPVFMEVAGAVRVFHVVLQTVGGVAKRVAGVVLESLWPSFREAKNATGPLQRLADWLERNETAVHNFTLATSNFIIDLVTTVVTQLPNAVKGFRLMSTGILTALDGIVSGAEIAFGWIPGIGDKFKKANREFDRFKNKFISGLHKAEDSTRAFAEKIAPRLQQNKLKMNIRDWNAKIKAAEKQLKNAKGEKKARLTADIRDWKKKVKDAERQLVLAKSKKTAKMLGDNRHWKKEVGEAESKLRRMLDRKTGRMFGNNRHLIRSADAAERRLNRIADETVYVNYVGVRSGFTGGLARRGAQGGIIRRAAGGLAAFPHGGLVRGAGSSMADAIKALVSNNEFVMRARSVRQYGTNFMKAVNDGRFPVALAKVEPGRRFGMGGAVGELARLVSSGRWRRPGSMLFEDISFQGMSSNFRKNQRRVADGFWAAVNEIKRARDRGTRVHEDMTFRGMSSNVRRFHSVIADVWRGNPWGSTFGDFGRWAPQGADRLPRPARRVTSGVVRPRPAPARQASAPSPIVVEVHGSIDPVATARVIRKELLRLQRNYGVHVPLLEVAP